MYEKLKGLVYKNEVFLSEKEKIFIQLAICLISIALVLCKNCNVKF